jgi:hypothetical protein
MEFKKMVKSVNTGARSTEKSNWWNQIPRAIKTDVLEAIRQADRGETMSHKEIKKKYAKWFTR